MRPRRGEQFSLPKAMEQLRSEFRAGRETRFQSRLTGVSSTGSGADYHFRTEMEQMRMIERARHYDRNDPIVGQGISRLVSNIVQDGFQLDPQTGDKVFDRELKYRWSDWANDPDQCHSEGEFTFPQMEAMALRSVFVDGDVVALPLKSGSLQWAEAHRLRTPRSTKRNVIYGVQVDEQTKRRVAYWLTNDDIDPLRPVNRVSDIKIYAARDVDGYRQVFHIYNPKRFSQSRGVTALAPISETIGMHDDIQFATLVKAQMAALVAVLRERDANWQPVGGGQMGEQTVEQMAGYTRTIEGVSAGLEIAGDPGEKLSFAPGNVPSPEFLNHAHLILTFIAINLDMPVHVLLIDPSNTNFSGWRGAIDQARLRWKQLQSWLLRALHSPVYRWKVRQWIQLDPGIAAMAAKSGVDPFAHRWNPPQFPYIAPLTDASSDLLQVRNGLNSHRRIQAARGREWEAVADELIQDNAFAIRSALREARKINEEFEEAGVHWRELVSLPTPDGVSVTVAAPANGSPAGNTPTNAGVASA